jgi:hypothetical protein
MAGTGDVRLRPDMAGTHGAAPPANPNIADLEQERSKVGDDAVAALALGHIQVPVGQRQ